jgi:PAS domain S-box-containing protein
MKRVGSQEADGGLTRAQLLDEVERLRERVGELERASGGARQVRHVNADPDEVVRDIVEQGGLRSAAAPRVSAGYEDFLDNFPGIAYQVVFPGDGTFRITMCKGAVESITGHSPEMLMSGEVFWPDVIHPADRAVLLRDREAMSEVPDRTGVHEYRIVRKDGRVRWIRDVMQICRHGGAKLIQGVLFDTSEEKASAEALRTSEASFRALAENIPGLVFRVLPGERNRMVFLSGGVEELTGFAADELGGARSAPSSR